MFKKYRNKIIISSLVIIGIILLLVGSCNSENDKDKYSLNVDEYTRAQENKIEDFLTKVYGVKEAKVILTLDTISTNNTSSANSKETLPSIRGVAVACTNGNNSETQKQITELLCAYLGISSNRIKIVSID